ncbi:MAG: hypothetical protein ACOCRK_01395 [bacterium]
MRRLKKIKAYSKEKYELLGKVNKIISMINGLEDHFDSVEKMDELLKITSKLYEVENFIRENWNE